MTCLIYATLKPLKKRQKHRQIHVARAETQVSCASVGLQFCQDVNRTELSWATVINASLIHCTLPGTRCKA